MYKFIALILLVLALGLPTPAVAAPVAAEEGVESYQSRRDLHPPDIEVTTPARGTAPGYVFIAPKQGKEQAGPMIVDNNGEVVWFLPLQDRAAADFRVQRYKGNPVLTWWEGVPSRMGIGRGEFVILDRSYREIARFGGDNRYGSDLHEFLITPRDTALVVAYGVRDRDLSPLGGPEDGQVYEGIVQEIDIASGRVLFEWHSLDHVRPGEICIKPPSKQPGRYDYFHINSVDLDDDGDLLVSARHTCAVYKVDRDTGEILWRLGGKLSDFAMGPGTRFAYQHDARRLPSGEITVLDNSGYPFVREQSRGLVLSLDMERMVARRVREYTHPGRIRSPHQANMQTLPNGNVFIGWGGSPVFSEFDRNADLLFDARLPEGRDSYRAYRSPWDGRPSNEPAVAATVRSDGRVTVYASWNGATEVSMWEVLAGEGRGELRRVARAPRSGFETEIGLRTRATFVAVRAVDSSGKVLGTSEAAPVVSLPDTGAGGHARGEQPQTGRWERQEL